MTNENSYFYLSQKAIASRITVARKMIFSLGMSPTCFRLAVECLRRQHTGSAWIKGRGSIRFRAGDSRFFVWSLLILNIEEVNKIQWYNYKTKATTVDRMGNAITGPSFEKKKSCLRVCDTRSVFIMMFQTLSFTKKRVNYHLVVGLQTGCDLK